MNKEEIKKSLDQFENDDFVDSKETLRSEIRNKMNTYLKKDLELKNDPLDVEKEKEEEEKEDE